MPSSTASARLPGDGTRPITPASELHGRTAVRDTGTSPGAPMCVNSTSRTDAMHTGCRRKSSDGGVNRNSTPCPSPPSPPTTAISSGANAVTGADDAVTEAGGGGGGGGTVSCRRWPCEPGRGGGGGGGDGDVRVPTVPGACREKEEAGAAAAPAAVAENACAVNTATVHSTASDSRAGQPFPAMATSTNLHFCGQYRRSCRFLRGYRAVVQVRHNTSEAALRHVRQGCRALHYATDDSDLILP
mgnify:CR=1 FL=1